MASDLHWRSRAGTEHCAEQRGRNATGRRRLDWLPTGARAALPCGVRGDSAGLAHRFGRLRIAGDRLGIAMGLARSAERSMTTNMAVLPDAAASASLHQLQIGRAHV